MTEHRDLFDHAARRFLEAATKFARDTDSTLGPGGAARLYLAAASALLTAAHGRDEAADTLVRLAEALRCDDARPSSIN